MGDLGFLVNFSVAESDELNAEAQIPDFLTRKNFTIRYLRIHDRRGDLSVKSIGRGGSLDSTNNTRLSALRESLHARHA
jgi:hypothetical protein